MDIDIDGVKFDAPRELTEDELKEFKELTGVASDKLPLTQEVEQLILDSYFNRSKLSLAMSLVLTTGLANDRIAAYNKLRDVVVSYLKTTEQDRVVLKAVLI